MDLEHRRRSLLRCHSDRRPLSRPPAPWDVARKLYPGQEAEQKRWMAIHQGKLLDDGKIEDLVAVLRAIDSLNPELLENIRTEADYFEHNKEARASDAIAGACRNCPNQKHL
jgi:hypothetical protein